MKTIIYSFLLLCFLFPFEVKGQIFDTIINTNNGRTVAEIQFYDDKKYYIGLSHDPFDSLYPSSYAGIYEVVNDTIYLYPEDIYIIDSVNVNHYNDTTLKNDEFKILNFNLLYERDRASYAWYSLTSEGFYIKIDDKTIGLNETIKDEMEGSIAILKKEDFNNPVIINYSLYSLGINDASSDFYFIHDFKNTIEIIYYIKAGFDNSLFMKYFNNNSIPNTVKIKNRVYYLKYYPGM